MGSHTHRLQGDGRLGRGYVAYGLGKERASFTAMRAELQASRDRFEVGDHLELMTPRGNLGFLLGALEKASGERTGVAPGDGHVVYLPLPADISLDHALLLRQLA